MKRHAAEKKRQKKRLAALVGYNNCKIQKLAEKLCEACEKSGDDDIFMPVTHVNRSAISRTTTPTTNKPDFRWHVYILIQHMQLNNLVLVHKSLCESFDPVGSHVLSRQTRGKAHRQLRRVHKTRKRPKQAHFCHLQKLTQGYREHDEYVRAQRDVHGLRRCGLEAIRGREAAQETAHHLLSAHKEKLQKSPKKKCLW